MSGYSTTAALVNAGIVGLGSYGIDAYISASSADAGIQAVYAGAASGLAELGSAMGWNVPISGLPYGYMVSLEAGLLNVAIEYLGGAAGYVNFQLTPALMHGAATALLHYAARTYNSPYYLGLQPVPSS